MLGAIIGDIVGSRFEWDNYRAKDFDFFYVDCFFTDDSVMSLAICKALLESGPDYRDLGENAVRFMRELGRLYPDSDYGYRFGNWLFSENPQPYESFGNGAAMRVSACGYAADSLKEAQLLAKKVTEVTHNHPEGIKGAQATASAVFLARTGTDMLEIRDFIHQQYYPMDFTLDGIRDSYQFNETCQDTVPQALMAFFESVDFEGAIRNAISVGGDSDTLAAITGGVAEAYYGIPAKLREQAIAFLDERLRAVLAEFEKKYSPKVIR